jgi:4-hydroxy-2-oxoglutarate aldolase
MWYVPSSLLDIKLVRGADEPAPFTVLSGGSDYILGSTAYGVQGAITGIANLAPRVCLKVFELASAGRSDEARDLALEISRAEWALSRGNILGTKVSH